MASPVHWFLTSIHLHIPKKHCKLDKESTMKPLQNCWWMAIHLLSISYCDALVYTTESWPYIKGKLMHLNGWCLQATGSNDVCCHLLDNACDSSKQLWCEFKCVLLHLIFYWNGWSKNMNKYIKWYCHTITIPHTNQVRAHVRLRVIDKQMQNASSCYDKAIQQSDRL